MTKKEMKMIAYVMNIFLILTFGSFMTIRAYYQYKIVKRVIPEITFWEWYWGFAK